MRNTFLAAGIVAILFGGTLELMAQAPATAKPETAKPETAKPAVPARGDVVPLRLLVTISRFQGDKKTSSLPYSLSVSANGPRVVFTMGAEVPYASAPTSSDTAKTLAYSYRSVGIEIIVSGQMIVEPGQYKMDINVSDSTLSSSTQVQGAPAIAGVPIFRRFNTSGTVVLRDGQTTQLTAAADPITGEMMRVDVGLTAVK